MKKKKAALGLKVIEARLRLRGMLGVLDYFCAARKVAREEILGSSHRAWILQARDSFWTYLRNVEKFPFTEIGWMVGRHHTSVMKGVRRFEAKRHEDTSSVCLHDTKDDAVDVSDCPGMLSNRSS